MEKKNKKKLFAIIGGSVLAFVLTIALSVSITLAYFGETQKADGPTVTLGSVLEFTDAGVTAEVSGTGSVTGMLPNQEETVQLAGTVKATTTSYFLRFKLAPTADLSEAEQALVEIGNPTISGSNLTTDGYKLVPHTDGYYYVCAAGEGSVPLSLRTGTAATDDAEATAGDDVAYTVSMTVKVPASVKNSDVTTTISIEIDGEMGIIQSEHIAATDVATLAGVWTTNSTDGLTE